MFDEKGSKGNGKINYKKLNDVIKVSDNVLKVVYFLAFVGCIYTVFKICQELKILKVILEILSILSPLFIGLVIAWLFNPVVKFLQKKGVKRILSVIIIYVLLIGALALIIGSIFPILYDQIISFASTVPSLFKEIEGTVDGILDKFQNIDGFDISVIKENIMSQLEGMSSGLTSGLTTYIVSIVKGLISGISTFAVGLVIGFFFLLSFDNVGETLLAFVPKRYRKDTEKLSSTINESLRNYVVGVVVDATVVFCICAIIFSIIGLRAPFLFAIFCAITNVIPYIGPYIGAVPAVIVGFSISPTVGILTLVAIIIIQFFEGNFLQEMIMSKTTKLHPVTIISGLLIFGHFWGMIGMVVSTPLLAVVKQLYLFFDAKYDFFKSDDTDNNLKNKKDKLNTSEEKQEDKIETLEV